MSVFTVAVLMLTFRTWTVDPDGIYCWLREGFWFFSPARQKVEERRFSAVKSFRLPEGHKQKIPAA